MKEFNLEIDDARNIRFTADLLGNAKISGSQGGSCEELTIYKTKDGNFICHHVERARVEGERDRSSAKTCKTTEEVKQFFGYGFLAKALYAEAGIEGFEDENGNSRDFMLDADEVSAAKYYLAFDCPDLIGTPVFEMSRDSGIDTPVTWINESDFTEAEYRRLETGDQALNKLGAFFQDLLEDNPNAEQKLFERLSFHES